MSHAPKHAMLIALQANRLSAAGLRRAERHLDGCDVCRNAASGHRELASLVESTRMLAPQAVSYDRMSLVLRREARAQSVASNRRTLAQALAVAAALGLAVFGASRLAWTPTPSVETAATAAPITREAQATTASADARSTARASDATPVGEIAITEGTLLSTSTQEQIVALWEGTEMVLAPGTEARVVKLRDHQLQVALLRGSIANQVAKLGASESYVIEVNDHRVTVRGTRFVVTRGADGKAEVTLNEGKVDVTRADLLIARMVAPARWIEDKSGTPATTSQTTKTAAVSEGSGDPNALRLGKPTRTERAGAGQVAPKAVQHLLARAAPLLRSCHEASKRTHPDLPSQLQLALQVAATGQVEAVEVRAGAANLPDDLVACLRARALTWHLTLQVAGPVQVLIPLQFGTTP